MSILNFNTSVSIFDNDERYDEFKSLRDLYAEGKKEYKVTGVYNYTSKFGNSCFAKSEGFNIQLPNHLAKTVEEIREDEEAVKQINEGRVFIEVYSYTLPDKYPDKMFYSINFILK